VLLDRWRPRSGGSRVLVTSRRDRWSPDLGVHPLPLGTLARSESLALLSRFREDLDPIDPVLDGIAAELGDLPLALHLAGGFLARYRRADFGFQRRRRSSIDDILCLPQGIVSQNFEARRSLRRELSIDGSMPERLLTRARPAQLREVPTSGPSPLSSTSRNNRAGPGP
jgi:hypothetical protein